MNRIKGLDLAARRQKPAAGPLLNSAIAVMKIVFAESPGGQITSRKLSKANVFFGKHWNLLRIQRRKRMRFCRALK